MNQTKSEKEVFLEEKIISKIQDFITVAGITEDFPLALARAIFSDTEVLTLQNYANSTSIVRLGYNDHGPVHMKTVCLNSVKILKYLFKAGIKTSLQTERSGNICDSLCAVILASVLHDTGMSIGRDDHEMYSAFLCSQLVSRLLDEVLPGKENTARRTVIKVLTMEGILCHMGKRQASSIEAGIILVADGCDMTKGRARIPMELSTEAKAGDIHKYSAAAIEAVHITRGDQLPVKISVEMTNEAGFFQIEEVLIPKIMASPIMKNIELLAGVSKTGQDMKKYL